MWHIEGWLLNVETENHEMYSMDTHEEAKKRKMNFYLAETKWRKIKTKNHTQMNFSIYFVNFFFLVFFIIASFFQAHFCIYRQQTIYKLVAFMWVNHILKSIGILNYASHSFFSVRSFEFNTMLFDIYMCVQLYTYRLSHWKLKAFWLWHST